VSREEPRLADYSYRDTPAFVAAFRRWRVLRRKNNRSVDLARQKKRAAKRETEAECQANEAENTALQAEIADLQADIAALQRVRISLQAEKGETVTY
jgi:hypothetical protein